MDYKIKKINRNSSVGFSIMTQDVQTKKKNTN